MRTAGGWVRVALALVAAASAEIGLWGVIAPHSFFNDYPGVGHHWVSALGTYNEHLVRDYAAAELGFAVLLLAAAIWFERRLVLVAGAAFLAANVPHFAYHLTTTDSFSTTDNVASLGAFVVGIVVVGAAMAIANTTPKPVKEHPMSRLPAAEPHGLDLLRRLTYATAKRMYGRPLEPARVIAHHRPLLLGYSAVGLAGERFSQTVPKRLKELAMLRTAQLVGCEWCLDFGSWLAAQAGIPDDDLRDLARWRESDRFDELDRLVLEYAEAMTRTPVDVTDELFAHLREHFDERQVVELTMTIALENLYSRSNWAFGIEGQGFSEGMYCVRPEPLEPAPAPAARARPGPRRLSPPPLRGSLEVWHDEAHSERPMRIVSALPSACVKPPPKGAY